MAKILGFFFFLFIIIQGVLLFPQNADRLQLHVEKELPRSERLSDAEQVLFGAHLVEAKEENKVWELWAEKAIKSSQAEDWHMNQVKVHFFSKGKRIYTATGTEGFVSGDQKQLEIIGEVQVTTINGYLLKTEKITYESGAREIFGPLPVEVIGPKEKKRGRLNLKAQKFRGEIDAEKLFLSGEVRGKKPMSDRRVMKISSQKAKVEGKSNQADFSGSVRIQVEALFASGPRAYFKFRDGILNQLYMNGGVRMKDDLRRGRADVAQIFFNEDKAIFTGKPRFLDGKNEIEGDRITLLNGGDRVQVVKLKSKYHNESE